MGMAKKQMMEDQDNATAAKDIAVQAGVLKNCDKHAEIYYEPAWDLTPAYKMASSKKMRDLIKEECEACPDTCPICDKNMAKDD